MTISQIHYPATYFFPIFLEETKTYFNRKQFTGNLWLSNTSAAQHISLRLILGFKFMIFQATFLDMTFESGKKIIAFPIHSRYLPTST